MSITCLVCGTENPDGSKSCLQCGSTLLPVANTLPVTPPSVDVPDSVPPPSAPGQDSSAPTMTHQDSVPPADPYLGAEILGYTLEERLGAGGMAMVYRGRHNLTGQLVAVKILTPELAGFEEARQRFLVEAQILGKLEHPNIVHLLNFTEIDGRFYLIMQYARGSTLEDLIEEECDTSPEQRRHLKPNRACWIAVEMLKGLGHAHRHDIIHRDVKPANVIVNEEDSTVKMMDFGIAKIAGVSKLTQDGMTLGTVHYMSPEQIQGLKDIDGRADLYSVGITLYEAIKGRPPFDGDSYIDIMKAHLEQTPPPLSGKVMYDGEVLFEVMVSSELEAVLRKALAKDRDERFATAEEMAAALMATPEMRQMNTEARLRAVESSRRKKHTKDLVRRILLWTMAAGVIGGTAWGAWWWFNPEPYEEEPAPQAKEVKPSEPEVKTVAGIGGIRLKLVKYPVHRVIERLIKKDPLNPGSGPYLTWHESYDPPVALEVYAHSEMKEVAAEYSRLVREFMEFYNNTGYSYPLEQHPLRIAILDRAHFLSPLLWPDENVAELAKQEPSAWTRYDFRGNMLLPESVWRDELPYWVAAHMCPRKKFGRKCLTMADNFRSYMASRKKQEEDSKKPPSAEKKPSSSKQKKSSTRRRWRKKRH